MMSFMVKDMCKDEQLKGSYQGTEQWCLQVCRMDAWLDQRVKN